MWYTLQNQELTTNLISGTSGTMRITKLAYGAIVCGPDKINQKILVNGRVWRFDFDRWFGPLWLRADGETRKCQNPKKAVWQAFQEWLEKYEH
jgi:hypothetical protein